MNQLQDKILAALRSIVEEHELEWVERKLGSSEGTVCIQRAGRFVTLLTLEYEFAAHQMRLILYRGIRHVGGRCGLCYDDGAAIEHVLAELRELLSVPICV